MGKRAIHISCVILVVVAHVGIFIRVSTEPARNVFTPERARYEWGEGLSRYINPRSTIRPGSSSEAGSFHFLRGSDF